MCEEGERLRLMLQCERYEYARSKMLEVVVEEIGMQEWSELRERSVSRQMELGLSAKWQINSRVLECKVFRQVMEDKNERQVTL